MDHLLPLNLPTTQPTDGSHWNYIQALWAPLGTIFGALTVLVSPRTCRPCSCRRLAQGCSIPTYRTRSTDLSIIPGSHLRCRQPAVLFLPGTTSGTQRLLASHRSHPEKGLGSLRQATLRRTRRSPQVCRSVHASRRHFQQSPARYQ